MLVLITVIVIAVYTPAWAERTDAREDRWERPADETASGVSGVGEAVGPGDSYIMVRGTPDNDNIVGSSSSDHIRGLGGDDTIYGQEGRDILEGGSGNDPLFGGGDNDHLRGEVGDDQLFGQAGHDLLLGGPGSDHLTGGIGNDLAYGGVGMDQGHYFVEGNELSSDYYGGGPGYDLFNLHVPPYFDIATANDIEIQFMASPGYLDFGMWGIDLVIANFEDLLIVWEPGAKAGGGEPLAIEETTWGGIKTLYR